MAGNLGERKGGTTSINERIERDWLNFPTIPLLQEAWIKRVTDAMMERVTKLKDATDADARSVGSNEEFRRLYIKGLEKLSRGMGVLGDKQTLTEEQSLKAWDKIVKPALERYREMRFRASAPPLPTAKQAPTEEEPLVAEPIPEEEEPVDAQALERARTGLAAFCARPEWHDIAMNVQTLGRFNAEFIPLLSDMLQATPRADRERSEKAAHDLYENVVYPMYKKSNPGSSQEELKPTFDAWLDGVWKNLVLTADLYR